MFTVMLVDDNPDHMDIIQEVIQDYAPEAELIIKSNGREALDYIKQSMSANYDGSVPSVVLMDIKMPVMDGFEALDAIKQDETVQSIPVVMLSTSENEEDVKRCYSGGANGFMSKPLKLDDLVAKVQACIDFWRDAVSLPQLKVAGHE